MKSNLESISLESPIGRLRVYGSKSGVSGISIGGKKLDSDLPVLKKAKKQLEEYFSGKRKDFDLPLHEEGTAFQKRVWAKLRNIPYGRTRSYSEIAQKLKSPKAVRAVGGANNKNSIPIITPCHRVIGKDGSLTGYALGLKKKRWLLEHEGSI